MRTPGVRAEKRASAEGADFNSGKLIRGVLAAVLLGFLFNILIGFIVDFRKIGAALSHISAVSILVPFLALFVVFYIDSLRFRLVFRRFGVKVSLRDGFVNNLLGYFFANVTPATIGCQPAQVLHFSRLGLDSKTASNIVFSRLLEHNIFQMIIVMAFAHKAIGMMATVGRGSYLLIAGILASIVGTTLIALGMLKPHYLGTLAMRIEHSKLGLLIARISKSPEWAERISDWSRGLGEGFKILWKKNVTTMILDIMLLAVSQVVLALSLYVPLAIFTGTPAPFQEFFISFMLCALVSLFVPTPGSSGSIEASYLVVMGALTGDHAATMSAVLVWRLGSYYLHLIVGGIVYFFFKAPKKVYEPDADGILSRVRGKTVSHAGV